METERNKRSADESDHSLGNEIKTYIENRIELFSITIAEEIASAISASVQKIMGLLFLVVGGIFLWIAFGFFLGELLDSQALGFALAALPLVIFGVMLYNRSSTGLEEKIQTDIIDRIALRFRSASNSASSAQLPPKEDPIAKK